VQDQVQARLLLDQQVAHQLQEQAKVQGQHQLVEMEMPPEQVPGMEQDLLVTVELQHQGLGMALGLHQLELEDPLRVEDKALELAVQATEEDELFDLL